MGTAVEVIGQPPSGPEDARQAGYAQVSPDYFRTLQIPFVAGRDFTADDRAGSPDVVIVDETFAAPDSDWARIPWADAFELGDGATAAEIIGVVRRRPSPCARPAAPGRGLPTLRQRCWGVMSLILRTPREASDITRAVRAELDAIDSDQSFEKVRTLAQDPGCLRGPAGRSRRRCSRHLPWWPSAWRRSDYTA